MSFDCFTAARDLRLEPRKRRGQGSAEAACERRGPVALSKGEEGVIKLTKALSTRRPLWQITGALGTDLPELSCLASRRPDA